jgi:hypothetical protein
MKWSFFLAAALLGAYLLLSFGAPLIPVAAGAVLAGCYQLWRREA